MFNLGKANTADAPSSLSGSSSGGSLKVQNTNTGTGAFAVSAARQPP